jgi:hypothetical protein
MNQTDHKRRRLDAVGSGGLKRHVSTQDLILTPALQFNLSRAR